MDINSSRVIPVIRLHSLEESHQEEKIVSFLSRPALRGETSGDDGGVPGLC